MWDKNSLPLGLAIGLLFPIFGFCLVYGIFDLLVSSGMMDEAANGWKSKRMRTIILIGICANVFWIRKYNQPFTGNTLRGIIMGTMLLSIIWFCFYYTDLYNPDI